METIEWVSPGENPALQCLQSFIEEIQSSQTASSSRTTSTSSSTSTHCEREAVDSAVSMDKDSCYGAAKDGASHYSPVDASSSSYASTLSTLLSTGQLSPLRCLLEIQEATRDFPAAFLSAFDRFVCWREMADNLCLYNPHYDKIFAAPKWAKDTLTLHQVGECGVRIKTT